MTDEEIRIANATSRINGASARNKDGSIRAIVPRYVAEHIDKSSSVLDYGAGKGAMHTLWLRELGFTNVIAYDFGGNVVEGLHDRNALCKQYSVVFASNVLNVQSSLKMLLETLRQIYDSLKPGGTLICNFPSSPRKMVIGEKDLEEIICKMFGSYPERVGGSKAAPMWKVHMATR